MAVLGIARGIPGHSRKIHYYPEYYYRLWWEVRNSFWRGFGGV